MLYRPFFFSAISWYYVQNNRPARTADLSPFPVPAREALKAYSTGGSRLFNANSILRLTLGVSLKDLIRDIDNERQEHLSSEESYLVRLADIAYVDDEKKEDTLYRTGFLIEPTEQMVDRLGAGPVEMDLVRQNFCDLEKTNLLAVFQYLIGNTDRP